MDNTARAGCIPLDRWLQISRHFAAGSLSLSHTERASWIIMSAKMNDNLCMWALKKTELVKYLGRREKDFREIFFFPETATWQTYQEVSLTGDKCLHSPSDISCLSLAFTSPPLPLLRSYINPLTPEVVSILDSSENFDDLEDFGSGCIKSTHAYKACLLR